MDLSQECINHGFQTQPFYYTQRLQTSEWREGQPEYSDHPLDRLFEADYMGNSDFEWGAYGRAYAFMMEFQLLATSFDVEHEGVTRTVYLVAPREIATKVQALMPLWLAEGCRSVEPSRFEDTFLEHYRCKTLPSYWENQADLRKIMDSWDPSSRLPLFTANERLRAWLDIENGFAWTLNPVVANMLQTAFGLNPYGD